MQSPAFANAVLFIWWDEGTTTMGGGGQVPLIPVSSRTPSGLLSQIPANHYSLLRTIEDLWGLPPLGQSATARSMTEFFNLLADPGFEQYQPPALGAPGWIADPSRQTPAVSETHQPHGGDNNGVCWTPGYLDCGLYQTITAPATGTYMATFYANADRPGGFVGVNVNGAFASSAGVDVRGFGNYGTPYVMNFTAAAGDTVIVWMYSPGTPGYVVIDDVSLVLVDSGQSSPASGGWTSQDIGNVGVGRRPDQRSRRRSAEHHAVRESRDHVARWPRRGLSAHASAVDAGLIVTSNDSTQLNTAEFESVRLTPAP